MNFALNLAKEIANSKFVKDAAAGAAIGALIAVPVPLIGPAIGAVLGAVLGVYKNLTQHEHVSDTSDSLKINERKKWMEKFDALLKIDELRKNGRLTEPQFQELKDEILNRI